VLIHKLPTRFCIPVFLVAVCIFSPAAFAVYAQSSQSAAAAQSKSAPLTLDEVMRLVKQGKSDPEAAASVLSERGVDFEWDEKIRKKLQKTGADDDLLAAIWQATPNGRAHMRALLTSPSGVDLQATPGEATALQDIQNESAPDHRLRLVEAFEKKYPSSPLLSYVYTEAAKAHQEKGDLDQAIASARKSLQLDPDNTFSLIILALVLPQPQELKGSPTEVSERLREVEVDANRVLTLLEKLKPRPGETDEPFKQRKGSLAADAHFALGMAATQKDQFAEALAQYQAAISATNKPTFQYYYRLAEAYASLGQVTQAIDSLRKASDLARDTPMQKYADDFMSELQQRGH
jgi:tetratricopeptide (TPR) repeat protein